LGDSLRLGCREDEDDAGWRLLEDLEERIPCFAGQHVSFVDDVDLVSLVAGRRIHRTLAQLAGVVDASVGRGVDLDDVEARLAAPNAAARSAFAARLPAEIGVTAALAVERHRENAGERRLADTSRATE
jgi:hypothetical protein